MGLNLAETRIAAIVHGDLPQWASTSIWSSFRLHLAIGLKVAGRLSEGGFHIILWMSLDLTLLICIELVPTVHSH